MILFKSKYIFLRKEWSIIVTVVMRSSIKLENFSKVLDLYKELIYHTNKEDGCLRYELFQEIDNPNNIALIEEWESEDYLRQHTQTPHFIEIVEKLSAFEKEERALIYKRLL